MLCLSIMGRLERNDTLGKWGINVDKLCGLCNLTKESLNYFFFNVQYLSRYGDQF